MHKTPLLLTAYAAASLALLGCQQKQPEVVQTNVDPQAEALKTAPPVELPPSIVASRSYRCKDNSLVYIDFMSNNTALLRKAKGVEPPLATVTAETAGGAYKSADGFTVSGNSEQITYSSPTGGSQSCKA